MLYLCSQLFTFYTKYQTHCPSLVSPPIQLSFSSGIQVECGVLRALPAPHCYFCCSIDIACCVRRHSTSPIHSLTASSSLFFSFRVLSHFLFCLFCLRLHMILFFLVFIYYRSLCSYWHLHITHSHCFVRSFLSVSCRQIPIRFFLYILHI